MSIAVPLASLPLVLLAAATFAGLAAPSSPLVATGSASKTYAVNSLIIPMDTDFQDHAILRAYGLVFKLLSNGVPVDWIVLPGKSYGQADFTADFREIKTAATGTHAYRGGPFVIDAAFRGAALPIVQAWQTADTLMVVHEATVAFTANVVRSLVAAPSIAVLDDGNSSIAFGYLNAAAIPDSAGSVWSAASPGLLTPTAVAGATTINHRDGALFDGNGVPLFSVFMSMHYNTTGVNAEAVAETTELLKDKALFFAGCQSVLTFENTARFLTDQSFTVKARPASVVGFFSDQPVAQADGLFMTVGGSEPAFAPTGAYLGTEGSDYFRIVRGPGPTPTSDVVILGNALQNAAAGRVVYLGGHRYTTAIPISANPSTQGVRYFLNAIFFTPAIADTTPPTISCPPPVTVRDRLSNGLGEVVSFIVTAADDFDPSPSVVCVPPSGSTFMPGTTLVLCTATDEAGNHIACQFPVTVEPKARRR